MQVSMVISPTNASVGYIGSQTNALVLISVNVGQGWKCVNSTHWEGLADSGIYFESKLSNDPFTYRLKDT
jgi:hypothetical protein